MSNLFTDYKLDLTVDRLVAGIPASEKMLSVWLEVNNAPSDAVEDQAAMRARIDSEVEQHSVIFYRLPDGKAAYESRCMKAALKEAANVLKGILDIKAYRSKLAERVYVHPKFVPLNDVTVEMEERPISVMTAMGPRTSIKRYKYVDNVDLSFTIRILQDKVVKPEHLEVLMEYIAENGIGSDRSQGAGTLLKWSLEPISD